MPDDRLYPWVMGTEHLGDLIVRFHFGGGIVRDVDLRSVLSTEEMELLLAQPTKVSDVRTTVMWPGGPVVPPEMLDLIFAGFGARKGWPKTAPPLSAGARFPVPSLEEVGVKTYGGGDPVDRVIASSGAPWRRTRLDAVTDNLRRNVDRLMLWWAEARDQLAELADAEQRRSLLRAGLADVAMVRMPLESLDKLLHDAGWGEALLVADDDVKAVVTAAARWNEIWVVREVLAASRIIDPLENPHGFCEELRGRLSDPNASWETPPPA